MGLFGCSWAGHKTESPSVPDLFTGLMYSFAQAPAITADPQSAYFGTGATTTLSEGAGMRGGAAAIAVHKKAPRLRGLEAGRRDWSRAAQSCGRAAGTVCAEAKAARRRLITALISPRRRSTVTGLESTTSGAGSSAVPVQWSM